MNPLPDPSLRARAIELAMGVACGHPELMPDDILKLAEKIYEFLVK